MAFKGVKVVDSFKFLGFTITCDRKMIVRDAKKSCNKFVAAIRGKIRCKNDAVDQLLFGAFYRSCLIFYLTPLRASGIVTPAEVSSIEAGLLKKHFLIPNDVKNKVVMNVCNNFKVQASEVIETLAKRIINQLQEAHLIPARMYRV